jgi:predicted enzyme related to lactoylglutathione lyase
MSERDGFQPGVPCWVEAWQPDPEAAVGFYAELFGWEAEDTTPPGAPEKYFVCRLRGRDVAAIASHPSGTPPVPAWGTYIWVASADETAAKVAEAGGAVEAESFDVLDAGRMAVLADPDGAVFSVWEPRAHRGAQLVNEPSAWSMSALNTRDLEGAKAFYGAVFGWETDTFDMDGGQVTLWRVPGYVGGEPAQPVSREVVATMLPMSGERSADDVPPHWSVDFWVDDVDAVADKAPKLGGRVVVPPYGVAGFSQAVLADPQGAAFSVSKVSPPA